MCNEVLWFAHHGLWDPVVEPAVVPRHPYTEAESQLTLVIRSGVAVPDPTGDPYTVDLVAPDDYAQQTRAAHPELVRAADHLVLDETGDGRHVAALHRLDDRIDLGES